MNFNIFNKKPESRLPLQKETSEKLKDDERRKARLNFELGVSGFGAILVGITQVDERKKLEKSINKAKKILGDIFDKDRSEAVKLNKEYESLMEEVAKTGDLPRLYKFETEKLGMHKEIEEVLSAEVEKSRIANPENI